jgi:hypothetical protein
MTRVPINRVRVDEKHLPVSLAPSGKSLAAYCALMLADLTIGPHFSTSALWKAPSAAGVS